MAPTSSTTLLAPSTTQNDDIVTSSLGKRCIHVKPSKDGYVPANACNSVWPYDPSFDAAVALSCVFGVTMMIHIGQSILHRKEFCWVIIMGAAWETTSFILRSLGAKNQQNTVYAIISQVFLLLAPLWINAFDYMVLGRLMHFFLPEKRIFRVKASSLSTWFVCLDIVSFLIQGVGGILLSNINAPASQKTTGKTIYMAGIGMQQGFIVLFTVLAITFQRRMMKLDKGQFGDILGPRQQKWEWLPLSIALYLSLALITTRIIYRLIEFAGGVGMSNPLPYHEIYMYALDALPMALALYVMNLIHPGRTLVGVDSEFPKRTRAEKKAAKEFKKVGKQARKDAKKNEKILAQGTKTEHIEETTYL